MRPLLLLTLWCLLAPRLADPVTPEWLQKDDDGLPRLPPADDYGVYGTKADLEITYIEKKPSCTKRAVPGSLAGIEHKGFVHANPEDPTQNGRQIDANKMGELLNVTVRAGQILDGMDLALEGMCVGEKLSVVMPPVLAFDKPGSMVPAPDGKNPIVPRGTSLRYEISLVTLEDGRGPPPRPNAAAGGPRGGPPGGPLGAPVATGSRGLAAALAVLLAVAGGLGFVFLRVMEPRKKKGAAGKGKKKR
ncbi:unnamed protein product [Prorocentrum cordatum]|uniref:peptidylprolyl isomerase n=1 Tax=Prorocentrum cordatum TaxID=2364126 RepID=A0ABN9R5I7_9DINO|nr:unnamed protein product [Polarella glacialis]